MQQKRENKAADGTDEILVGLFSKKEAAHRIAGGCRHIHSSVLGQKDAGFLLTQTLVQPGANIAPYPWEPRTGVTELVVQSSSSRLEMISKIIVDTGIQNKRHLNEKVSSVLEELMTNAIYHAYRNNQGGEKYTRSKKASLAQSEKVTVGYHANENGIFLSVADRGGTLGFKHVTASFQRCYGNTPQIETKESGAGLGIYMIFEYASHLKIVTEPGKFCQVSCWLADKKSFDPDNFSFNFFERRR